SRAAWSRWAAGRHGHSPPSRVRPALPAIAGVVVLPRFAPSSAAEVGRRAVAVPPELPEARGPAAGPGRLVADDEAARPAHGQRGDGHRDDHGRADPPLRRRRLWWDGGGWRRRRWWRVFTAR